MEKGGFNNSLRDSRKIFMKKAPQPGQSAQQAAIQTKPMGVSARAVTFAANSKIVLYMETYMNGLSPKGMKSGINHNN